MVSVLAFAFAARDTDFDDEIDFGEHVDFDFLRLCFFGIQGRSTGGRSLSVSSVGRLPIASPKSTQNYGYNNTRKKSYLIVNQVSKHENYKDIMM